MTAVDSSPSKAISSWGTRPGPTFRALSLGAGVQSTTLLLLAAEGLLPTKPDFAIFADTGWEPAAVYAHLDRLERHLIDTYGPDHLPIHRVGRGNLRDDLLNPHAEHYAQMPLYILGENGSKGRLRRQCTADYKIAEIKREVRRVLGCPHPKPVPAGAFVEQWIGISSDESGRATRMLNDVQYMELAFPLLFLRGGTGRSPVGWTRADCERFLESRGFGDTPRSACIGCPVHTNRTWREMRDNRPQEFAQAVEFDRRIRRGAARALANGAVLRGQAFLHASRLPLDQAPIDRVTANEWAARQSDMFDALADDDMARGRSAWGPQSLVEASGEVAGLGQESEQAGCSPWSCRTIDEDDPDAKDAVWIVDDPETVTGIPVGST